MLILKNHIFSTLYPMFLILLLKYSCHVWQFFDLKNFKYCTYIYKIDLPALGTPLSDLVTSTGLLSGLHNLRPQYCIDKVRKPLQLKKNFWRNGGEVTQLTDVSPTYLPPYKILKSFKQIFKQSIKRASKWYLNHRRWTKNDGIKCT